jgi:benzoyl-CoA reductase/2-hydroxyglutaryl-CoA dehydratase subunit BcrC/BadD/HgdB
LKRVVERLELIAEHRRQHPTTTSDELYYRLLASYFRRPVEAGGQGVIAHTLMVPDEILHALDLIPFHLEGYAAISVPLLKDSEELLGLAKGLGLAAEVCSVHRCQAAWSVKGSIPCQAVVSGHVICDSSYKSGLRLQERCGVPGFYVDRAYRYEERDDLYYAGELQELVHFLEGVAGRALDWERLAEIIEHSRRMVELHREIYQLRSALPCPSPNRLGSQLMVIGWLFSGTPEGVRFYETVRDELHLRVAAGKGYIPQERFRILSTFPVPGHHWKLLDWMEREHGAVIVADTYCSRWGDFDWDPSRPLLTLARKWTATPLTRQMHAPTSTAWLPDILRDAREHQVEGALYWAHIGCGQGCAPIRMIKEALKEQVGVPTLVLDMDVLDPSFVTEEELRDRIEGFFELLEEKTGGS